VSVEDGECTSSLAEQLLNPVDPMQGMSEDEGDVDQTPEVEIDTAKETEARKARTERAEKLRKMMDDDGMSHVKYRALKDCSADIT
jgi:hypothetical protein